MKHLVNVLFSYILFIFSVFGISSCKKNIAPNANNQEQTVTYDSLTLNEEIPLVKTQASPVNKLSVHFLFPSSVSQSPVLEKKYQKTFVQAFFGKKYADFSPKQALDSFCLEYKKEYLSTAADYNDAKSQGLDVTTWGNNYQLMKLDTLPSVSGVISFKTFVENFAGGAHGSHQTVFYNMNTKTGELITESSLFKAEYEKKLKRLIIEKLVKDNKKTTPEQLVEMGFFDPDELKLNNNFLLRNDGILFAFNEYEIAPYSMGLIQVFIPNADLSDIRK